MSTNSNFILLLLLLLVIPQIVLSAAGQFTASTTLLITGHSSNNLYKYAFAQNFASQVELDRAHSSDIVVISSDVPDSLSQEDGLLLRTVGGSHLNFSQVVVTRLGTQEMSLDHIQHLYSYIDTDEPLIVVEIGEQSIQTRALLNKGALCWGEASADILSPNRAYLCNDVSPEIVKKVVDINSIRSLEEGTKVLAIEPARSFWPNLFASAARTEKQNRKKQAQETIEVEEDDVEEIVDRIMENIEKAEPKHPKKSHEPTGKKLGCKYRKSCYESGKLPELEDSSSDWFDWNTVSGYLSWGEKKGDQEEDHKKEEEDDDDEENLTPRKLKCKYRLDCYKAKGIKLSGKDGEREERKSILAGKAGPQQGKKKTLKEIAERTVQKVKVAEEKAAARPLSSAIIVERKINKMEEKLSEKLHCKYRKSCYETGELPEIAESSWSLPVFSTHSAEEAVEEVDFQEMEDLERKVFCKYRKSCYETGVKPDIDPDIQINSFSDLRDLPDVIETRKQTIQEKCKYRKSCYKTGILPDLNSQIEHEIAHKEINTVVPTNIGELKKFCKYRKSCYEEIAQSASVETVTNIRRRRVIEKEVKRRKARRSRMRRRLHDVDLEAGVRKHKSKRYTVQANETEQKQVEEPAKEERQEEEEAIPEPVVHKQPKKKVAKVEEPVPEVEKPAKLKRAKREEEQQPETEPEPVVEEPPKLKKKGKKTPPEPEPEPEREKEPEPVAKKPKHKKGKKEESKEEEEEIEQKEPEPTAVVEELPAVKVVHKEKKQKKAKEPKESEPKEEDDEKKENNLGYKEKLELQAHCKYRKSCYDTKERPVIDQTLTTLFDKFDTHVNEHYDRLENAELSPADKKLACKYRRSCYETNKRPIIVQTLTTIWARAASSPSPDEPRNVHVEGLKTAEKNLLCKYRKSCYETGFLPEVLNPAPEEWKGNLEEPENWHKDEHRKLACKYRQSCYSKHGWSFGHEEEKEGEKKKEVKKGEEKPVKKEAPKVKEAKEHKPAKEHKKKVDVKPVPVVKVEEDDDDEVEKEQKKEDIKEDKAEAPEIDDEDLPHMERGQKLGCKYRKSCYVNATPEEAPTRTVTVAGVTQRTKCNQYYLSCREKLGLPPKEKAPIGPSGRRLCRKKKTDQ